MGFKIRPTKWPRPTPNLGATK